MGGIVCNQDRSAEYNKVIAPCDIVLFWVTRLEAMLDLSADTADPASEELCKTLAIFKFSLVRWRQEKGEALGLVPTLDTLIQQLIVNENGTG